MDTDRAGWGDDAAPPVAGVFQHLLRGTHALAIGPIAGRECERAAVQGEGAPGTPWVILM